MVDSSNASPIPRWILAALIAGISLAWGASAAYATLSMKPLHKVYIIDPWPDNLSLVGGGCVDGIPVIAASPRGLIPSTYLYSGEHGWWAEIPGLRPQAACAGPGYLAVAGSLNGSPALALAAPGGGAVVYTAEGVEASGFSAVYCGVAGAAAAGVSPSGVVVMYAGLDGRAWASLTSYLSPVESVYAPNSSSIVALTGLGVLVFAERSALMVEPRYPNASWVRVAPGPDGEPWLVGSTTTPEGGWGLLAPLSGGEALRVRAHAYGGLVLDARWDEARGSWLVYYRPGSYWDSLVRVSTTSGGGVKLMWTGPHEVVQVYFDDAEVFTLTLVTQSGRQYVVAACLDGLRRGDYWLSDRSIMHVTLIPHTEAIEVSPSKAPHPEYRVVRTTTLVVNEQDLAALVSLPAPSCTRAQLRWEGPLVALTYVALSIALLGVLWRTFVG